MTFLAPFALIGSLLLLVPVLAHLFKPRKMKETPFSSLRWLKETRQRLSRRIQWHQWLLFLVRAACLLFLVIALAKPLIGGGAQGRPTDRFLILDVSRSMGYQLPDEQTPMDRARTLATGIANSGRSGDRTAVLLAGAAPRLASPLDTDPAKAIAMLQSGKMGLADGCLSTTLPVVQSLLPSADDRDVELIFFTDNLKARWRQADIQSFLKSDAKPRVKIIDVGASLAPNAWIADARVLQFGADDDRWIQVDLGCVGEPRAKSLRLTGIQGAADDSREVTLRHGQSSGVFFRLPAKLDLQGQVAELRLEPTDALPSDDVFWLNLDATASMRVLIIEPPTPGPDGRPVGIYLHTAMEALANSKKQTLEILRQTSAEVSPGEIARASVIFLASVPELNDANLDALETRVRGGAGLAIFLGPRMNPSFYQQKLHRSSQPESGLLPLTWKSEAEPGRLGELTNIRWAHPILAAMKDPVLSDFSRTQFFRYFSFSGLPGKNDSILATIDNEAPALIEHPYGNGRVLAFNTSANGEWNDLTTQRKSFLTLVDRTLGYLSAGGLGRQFVVGNSVTMSVPFSSSSETQVTTPGGKKLTPRILTVRGEGLLFLDELEEAGSYRAQGTEGKPIVFTVNCPRTDSPLSPMDTKVLKSWWGEVEIEVIGNESALQAENVPGRAWPVWPALILLAGVLLVVETIYVHRLCPRADPKAAQAVVGILKPVGES